MEELRFAYPLLRTVSYALPGHRTLAKLKKEGKLWQAGMLFVGPFAVAASSEMMTVAFDKIKDNPRTVIDFPPGIRSAFRQRGRIACQDAVWETGVWTIPDRGAVVGARRINDFLIGECPGGMGMWSGWDWLSMLFAAVARPPDPSGAVAVSGSTLGRVQHACTDFHAQPVGIHVRVGRVVITYPDHPAPRVISILSPWRGLPVVPEWAKGNDGVMEKMHGKPVASE